MLLQQTKSKEQLSTTWNIRAFPVCPKGLYKIFVLQYIVYSLLFTFQWIFSLKVWKPHILYKHLLHSLSTWCSFIQWPYHTNLLNQRSTLIIFCALGFIYKHCQPTISTQVKCYFRLLHAVASQVGSKFHCWLTLYTIIQNQNYHINISLILAFYTRVVVMGLVFLNFMVPKSMRKLDTYIISCTKIVQWRKYYQLQLTKYVLLVAYCTVLTPVSACAVTPFLNACTDLMKSSNAFHWSPPNQFCSSWRIIILLFPISLY